MAGERLRPDGFTEISAVCTHPDFQGKGLGKTLTAIKVNEILNRGETAFLHVVLDNPPSDLGNLDEALGRLGKPEAVTPQTHA